MARKAAKSCCEIQRQPFNAAARIASRRQRAQQELESNSNILEHHVGMDAGRSRRTASETADAAAVAAARFMFGKDLVVAASSKRRSSRKITPRVQSTTTAIIVLASLIASGLFGNPALQRHAHLRSVLEATSVHARLTVESDEKEEATGAISQLLRRFEVAPKSSADAGEPHYLVVCRKVESYFLPVLSKFKVIRLEMGDNPPPWNAKAILHAEKCMTNPYVVEALERRKRAPFLVAPTMSDTSPAVVYGV
ncbi:hypothetical protein THAOC_20860, partial [Thalassiosira oceanica]